MEQVLVLHLDQWNVFPEYLIFLGFLNQLLGITDNIQSETSVVLDLLFLGQDARMSSQEAQQRDFILQTIYLEAVGKWGWTGLIFMSNLGSTGWQKLFVTENDDGCHHPHHHHHQPVRDSSTELDLLLGPTVSTPTNTSSGIFNNGAAAAAIGAGGALRRGGGEGKRRKHQRQRLRQQRYGALARNTSGVSTGKSNMMGTSIIEGPRSSSADNNMAMITFINTEAGTSLRQQSTQIMIVNDYTRSLRGYIEQLPEDGQRRTNSVECASRTRRTRRKRAAGNNTEKEEEEEALDHLDWNAAPGQVTVVSKNIRAGAPYRLVVNVGDLAGDGKDGFVVMSFTTPNHGDAQLHLRAILNAKEIRFGVIDQDVTICELFKVCGVGAAAT
eukprot:CAMPEP_0185262868 /NCGR_PEP_ID=MMETSP1359-20130426/10907_1 /TAXON_ID=552665 /ORGANISM="Bigelowiella longifila, Strain CCMP242" /LENGTH=384 /DNA_ID=CAMNT_0027849933 /DNA_START=3 /DNA_END=1157 /DNA_ORIENTATION=+